jgi:uncharacterized hydrophobic protein (TIGR00271 family)
MWSDWAAKNRFSPTYLPVMEGQLFFEGEGRIRAITNYVVLLTLATIIATYGVISGSTATVIGAMIIAPLMTPIMATTLAIVLGESPRMSRSVGLVCLSIVFVVGLAIVLSSFISSLVIGFSTNPEITTRVSPNLIALLVALASGAAGAFAVSREDVSNTLPGVAISISLVPPLSVVGISLAKAQLFDAGGAMLLFLTNFLAIILAGGAVFWFSGVNARRLSAREDVHRKRAVQIAVIGVVIVAILLGLNGYHTTEADRDTALAQQTVMTWLNGSSYGLSSVTINYPPQDFLLRGTSQVQVTIVGTGNVPTPNLLALQLERALGHPVTVVIKAVPQQLVYYPTPPGPANVTG